MTNEDLRAWRAKHRLTQRQLAEALGVALITVQKWEQGTRPTPPLLPLALKELHRQTRKGK